MPVTVSIIVPTFNEQSSIPKLIDFIFQNSKGADYEILVADGGSTDRTQEWVQASRASLVYCPVKGRAAQLNFGATKARGDVLFFLHSDSIPPADFLQQIFQAVKAGTDAGCFRLKFDASHWFLRVNAWFTRFDVNAVRFGDQGLFVSRQLFRDSGGYREDHIVMEDQEMVIRLKKLGARFVVLPDYVTTSARRYLDNGPLRLQWIFFLIWLYYYQCKPQQFLVELYRRKITNSKIHVEDAERARKFADDIRKKSPQGKGENAPCQRCG